MIHFLGSKKVNVKLMLLSFCCASQLVFAQNGFDPFATEFPPEAENRGSSSLKRDPTTNQNSRKKQNPRRNQGSSEKDSRTDTRTTKQPKKVQQKKLLSPKIEQLEPSYISGPLDFKVEVGVEHNFVLSAFKPSVDFARLTSDQVKSDYLLAEEILYPSLRLKGGRGLVIQTRPTLSGIYSRFKKKNKRQGVETKLNADATELFVSITPSGRFSLQIGRQNFQWSPAELGSPSNWIYQSDKLGEYFTRSPQSKVDTRDLIKAGLSFGQSFSLIAMAEYEVFNRDRPQVYQGRRAAGKAEFSWNDAASSIGIVVGAAERLKFPFVGEYFSLSLGEAFTIYADASHKKGSSIVKPVIIEIPDSIQAQRVVVFDQPKLESEKLEHEAILGMKFTFLNGLELRLEGAYSSVGLTKEELDLVRELQADESPLLPIFFDPGAEFRPETAAFLGLRRVGFGKGGRWTMFARYFVPLNDASGGLFGYGEYLFSDNSVLFLSAGGYHGSDISQSAFPRRWSLSVGQKYVW